VVDGARYYGDGVDWAGVYGYDYDYGDAICDWSGADDLPTTAAAQCGLVLVLNAAPGRGVDGMGLAVGLAMVNGFVAVLGWVGLL
jgi:hypothetical protein